MTLEGSGKRRAGDPSTLFYGAQRNTLLEIFISGPRMFKLHRAALCDPTRRTVSKWFLISHLTIGRVLLCTTVRGI